MEEIPAIAKYGFGGAAALLSALALLWYAARRRREAKSEERRAALRAELADAEKRHAACLEGGDALGAVSEARRIDRLRSRLARLGPAAVLLCVLPLSGCRAPAPEARAVVLSDHCRAVSPGDTVPDLPAGESRWWLCTPRGLRLMMPADAALPPENP